MLVLLPCGTPNHRSCPARNSALLSFEVLDGEREHRSSDVAELQEQLGQARSAARRGTARGIARRWLLADNGFGDVWEGVFLFFWFLVSDRFCGLG